MGLAVATTITRFVFDEIVKTERIRSRHGGATALTYVFGKG
jgi:hypothetical protein